jgi:hypothetical protein
MLACLCFADALLYDRPISSDQNLANWSSQNQNEWPMRFLISPIGKLITD